MNEVIFWGVAVGFGAGVLMLKFGFASVAIPFVGLGIGLEWVQGQVAYEQTVSGTEFTAAFFGAGGITTLVVYVVGSQLE